MGLNLLLLKTAVKWDYGREIKKNKRQPIMVAFDIVE